MITFVACILLLLYFSWSYLTVNDVTTTPDDPPQFIALKEYHPTDDVSHFDLKPFRFEGTMDEFLAKIPKGEVVYKDEQRAELVYTTPIFRFKDDVVIELRDGSVHIRSASRVGMGDLGVNYRRIRTLSSVKSE